MLSNPGEEPWTAAGAAVVDSTGGQGELATWQAAPILPAVDGGRLLAPPPPFDNCPGGHVVSCVTQINLHRVVSEALASMQLLGKEHGVQKVEKAEAGPPGGG